MSTKLIVLICLAVVFGVIVLTSKGFKRLLLLIGTGALCLLSLLIWSGRIAIPDLLEVIKEAVGA